MPTIEVPLTGSNINSTGSDGGGDWVNGRWTPGNRTRRASLHDIHVKPAAVQEEEPPPQPVDVPQYAQPYTPTYDAPQQASNFTQHALPGATQEGNMGALSTHEEMPNLDEDFDPYDTEQLGAFIQRSVQAALTPSRRAQSDAEMVEQYNRAVSRFGDDGNFKTAMAEALEACLRDAQAGKPMNIEQAYADASEATSRRPGQRTSHLPSKAKTIKGLGELIDFNHRTGRARPYRSR